MGGSVIFSVIQYLSLIYLFFWVSSFNIIYIHVNNEGDVFEVIEEVCDSNAGEDHVDGVPHVPVGEHQDVGKVEQGAQDAHQHCQPAVDWVVKLLKGKTVKFPPCFEEGKGYKVTPQKVVGYRAGLFPNWFG